METSNVAKAIKPLSVEDAEKQRLASAWMAIWPLMLVLSAGFMLLSFATEMSLFMVLLQVSIILCGITGVVGYIKESMVPTDTVYKHTFDYFTTTFGDDPTEDRTATQIVVDSVLSSMKRSVQGNLDRKLGALRKHKQFMTNKTAAALADRREDVAYEMKELENAVISAKDWRYTVPDGILDFEKK